MSSSVWPFDQPRNCATVTLRSIVADNLPILYVSHDADDHGWQFLDGQPLNMSNALLVSLSTIVEHDPTVVEVADLPPGWVATRIAAGSPWKRQPTDGT